MINLGLYPIGCIFRSLRKDIGVTVILIFAVLCKSYSQTLPSRDANSLGSITRIDTIFASTGKTTSIIFPAKISLYDIGSEDFEGIKEDNLLLLKAAHDKAAPTSLIIKYGENIYHGTLAYSFNPPKLFIDFNKINPIAIPQLPNGTRVTENDSLKSLDGKISGRRLNLLLAEPKITFKTIAEQKERITLSLADMMTDQENVYLKLLFINDSKLDYKIDFTEFIYQDPLNDKDLKGAFEKKNVYPINSNQIDLIKAKEQRYLGYAIPRYALSKKGNLIVVIRQQNGSRAMTLNIPFSLILESKQINR